MTDRSLVPREVPLSHLTPAIPLVFIHPGLSPPQAVSILWAHRKAIVLIGTGVLLVAAILIAVWPRTYVASVTLMVNYEVNDPLNGKELPVGQLGSYIATQVELMQTPEVLLAVVDRLGLVGYAEFAEGYQDRGTLREWAATRLRKGMAIYQGNAGSQLIYITFASRDPQTAALVANAIAEVYEEQDYIRSTEPPGERAKLYLAQLNELKAKVGQAQRAVTDFHQRHNLIEDTGHGNVDVELLANLDSRLLEAQNERRLAEARASLDPSVSDQAFESDLVQTLTAKLAEQKLALAQHDAEHTAKHPGRASLVVQVEGTRNALASVLRDYEENAAAGLTAASVLEDNLQLAVNDQRAKVLAQGELHDTAQKYLLELDSAQLVYKRALEGYDQVLFASAGHYRNISVVSRAIPPASASKPSLLRAIALAAFAAGTLGFGIPLTYELFNRRVRCRDDIERQYGIPVLAEFDRLPIGARA